MSLPYVAPAPLTVEQVRAIDGWAIHTLGIPGPVLMENAGRAVAEVVYAALRDPVHDHVVVLCGPGNNGGDGFVAARHLLLAGVRVTAVRAATGRGAADAEMNRRVFESIGGVIVPATAGDPDPAPLQRLIHSADVLVDALLGTGSTGAPRDVMAHLIRLANDASAARRIAIDLPSGLDAADGTVADPCLIADLTVTFVAEKTGFTTASARRVLGRVVVAGIGVPPGGPVAGLASGRLPSNCR